MQLTCADDRSTLDIAIDRILFLRPEAEPETSRIAYVDDADRVRERAVIGGYHAIAARIGAEAGTPMAVADGQLTFEFGDYESAFE